MSIDRGKKTATKSAKPGGGAAAGLIKPVIIITILGGLGYVGNTIIKGLSYDPAKHQQETVAKLKVGMTVKQIVAAAGPPVNVYRIRMTVEMVDAGDGTKVPMEAPEQLRVDYREPFMQAYSPEDLKDGFWFVYSFFAGGKYVVSFDQSGTCTDIQDASGMPGLPG